MNGQALVVYLYSGMLHRQHSEPQEHHAERSWIQKTIYPDSNYENSIKGKTMVIESRSVIIMGQSLREEIVYGSTQGNL